jgi:cold shock CspA family protein
VEDIQIGTPIYNPEDAVSEVRTGVLSFFNTDKGFGFINETPSGARVFVHISQLPNSVKENDKLSYEVEMGDRGLNAINVKKIG